MSEIRYCKHCGKPVSGKYPNRNYCNNKCYYAEYFKKKPVDIVICKGYGKSFKQKRSNQLFHNPECANRYHSSKKLRVIKLDNKTNLVSKQTNIAISDKLAELGLTAESIKGIYEQKK